MNSFFVLSHLIFRNPRAIRRYNTRVQQCFGAWSDRADERHVLAGKSRRQIVAHQRRIATDTVLSIVTNECRKKWQFLPRVAFRVSPH